MTARVAVVDTNVVVSGLLTSGIDTPTSRILDSMLSGALRFALSVELLAEYRSVLLRKKIRSRHGLDEAQIDTILTAVAENAVIYEPADPPSYPPDHGDLHLWALLAARPGAILVTGDQALVDNPPDWASVVTPRTFLSAVKG
jgi:putative PIN family toxin of toxin-antitoxin system